jgi:hypothetical protein
VRALADDRELSWPWSVGALADVQDAEVATCCPIFHGGSDALSDKRFPGVVIEAAVDRVEVKGCQGGEPATAPIGRSERSSSTSRSGW